MTRPEIGSTIETWFSGRPDRLSTVLAVHAYAGRYPQWFTWIVKLSAPNTRRGWMEMAL